MPRMLVPRPNADTPDSERKVFAALERHLPHDWTVFHSRRIVLTRKRGGSLEAELEFRIIDPARGILGLEVKGALRSAATRSYSGGSPRPPHQVTGAQAERAMQTLQDYLRSTPATVPAFGWGSSFRPQSRVRRSDRTARSICDRRKLPAMGRHCSGGRVRRSNRRRNATLAGRLARHESIPLTPHKLGCSAPAKFLHTRPASSVFASAIARRTSSTPIHRSQRACESRKRTVNRVRRRTL